MIEVAMLRVEHLQHVLLDDVSFSLRPGEIVGLLGPNGAGKSTLMNTMVGLRHPTSGSVLVDGKPVNAYSARERARMLSYVAQKQDFLWDLKVAEIIELGATSRQRAAETMTRLELDEFASRSIKSLSGGEQARVMIARALAAHTPFLFADEPAASLDIKQQRAMMRILRREAHDKGTGVLVVLHELNLAFTFVDRILLMDRGRLVLNAAANEVAQSFLVDSVFGESFVRISVDGHTLVFPAAAGI
jgi:iron complex transport system ATP-binding protein